MTTTSSATNHLWFLNTLVTILVSEADGQDHISVLDHLGPYGFSPPLHRHHTQDETFYVLEGEFRFHLDGQEHRVCAGETFLVPKGIPHQFRIESPPGGRWLTITVPGDFERFVRAMSRPAERFELPEPASPSPEAVQKLTETAAQYSIEILGPPLQ